MTGGKAGGAEVGDAGDVGVMTGAGEAPGVALAGEVGEEVTTWAVGVAPSEAIVAAGRVGDGTGVTDGLESGVEAALGGRVGGKVTWLRGAAGLTGPQAATSTSQPTKRR